MFSGLAAGFGAIRSAPLYFPQLIWPLIGTGRAVHAFFLPRFSVDMITIRMFATIRRPKKNA